MKDALDVHASNWSLFGGEPLIAPIDEIEKMLKWRTGPDGKFRCTGIQTDGHLMTEEHIQLFIEHGVHVGFSIDGPNPLNDSRPLRGKTVEESRESTDHTIWALERLLELGQNPSIISTMHALNMRGHRIWQYKDWILGLKEKGLKSLNMHSLEVDMPSAKEIELENQEVIFVYEMCMDLHFNHGITVSPISDWVSLMQQNEGQANCVWVGCDNHSTSAVQGIDGSGQLGNCGRTNKHGVRWAKAPTGYERYSMLRRTPMEHGGCKDCRFWLVCKGACPGEAELGDWRGKTEHCSNIKGFLPILEKKMQEQGMDPITLNRELVEKLSAQVLQNMDQGQRMSMFDPHLDTHFDHMDQHGDHMDSNGIHETEHGDTHGDHQDDQHQDYWDSCSR